DEVGKCFGRGTRIRMYDGSVRSIEDVKEGDMIMGDDSTARRAYGITSGREEMYRVVPNKWDSWTCNKSHILSLKWCLNKPYKKKGWEAKATVNISVEE